MGRPANDAGAFELGDHLRRRLLGDTEVPGELGGGDVVAIEEIPGGEPVDDRHLDPVVVVVLVLGPDPFDEGLGGPDHQDTELVVDGRRSRSGCGHPSSIVRLPY